MLGVEKGGPHVFRRFRATLLRTQKAPEDLIRMCLGRRLDGYGPLCKRRKEKLWRKQEAKRVGVGFTLPMSVVPKVPKIQQASAVETAA